MPRERDRLVVAALVELRIANEAEDPSGTAAGAETERDSDSDPEPVPRDPLEISIPGTRLRSGWWPSFES